MLRDKEETLGRLMSETGLSRGEALLYLRVLAEGGVPADEGGKDMAKLSEWGMVILSGDGRRLIPVHPRLAVANHYRAWRESMVREMNERRMRVDRLILELIPLYEAATEKRAESGGG